MDIGVTEQLHQEHAAREWHRCVTQARQCNGTNGVVLVPRSAVLYAAELLDDLTLLDEAVGVTT